MRSEIEQAKQAIRTRMWDLLEQEHVAERGVRGYIPAFVGAEVAAERLAESAAWQAARVVKAVPDRAQQPVRERALRDGKLLYMAVPGLAEDPPFCILDPSNLPVSPAEAASRHWAAEAARRVGTNEMQPVDMVICGSVAVDRRGARLGKGAGYSDIEVALLQEAALISSGTVIATTVHPLQVVGEPLPEADHDFRVDLIVTTEQMIECAPPRRPGGLVWEHLDPDKIAAIPVLARRAGIGHG